MHVCGGNAGGGTLPVCLALANNHCVLFSMLTGLQPRSQTHSFLQFLEATFGITTHDSCWSQYWGRYGHRFCA